ncbi:hypothetical protein [Helicobacter sp. 'CLO3_human']|uniref:hypothetical protein n=1 Tax=Helicobacter sp. 'CLO3_human' TaxID=2020249 RepID=UPI001F37BD4A|nr:hypothetical protein [Helicobacter sp. 'CLO3_human']
MDWACLDSRIFGFCVESSRIYLDSISQQDDKPKTTPLLIPRCEHFVSQKHLI